MSGGVQPLRRSAGSGALRVHDVAEPLDRDDLGRNRGVSGREAVGGPRQFRERLGMPLRSARDPRRPGPPVLDPAVGDQRHM